MSATIYQVAEHAGVSIATVSRVLRGTAAVAPPTRERVLAAVDEFGYTPSRLGRSLAEGRHAANGMVFPDLSGPYYAEVVLGYEAAAAELGRSVLILSTHGRADARELVLDLASRVDGLVVLGRTVDDETIDGIGQRGTPVVTVARPSLPGIDAINAENLESAHELATHLIGHGHRRVVFLGDVEASFDAQERWTGVIEACAASGAEPPRQLRCPYDEEHGRVAAAELLSSAERPDVLVCANDEIALGAVLAAEDAAVRIPEELALTGWDDVMAARYSRPALTTVRQPMRRLGARAAHLLHERLTGQRAETVHDVLPTQLVVRASCGRHLEPDMQEER